MAAGCGAEFEIADQFAGQILQCRTARVQAGGPVTFSGIAVDQTQFVDPLVDELTSGLQLDTKA
jgi:hypothetical protein